MTEISAADVKALRDRTGAGMLACRDALNESGGDLEKAIELLRASGEAQATMPLHHRAQTPDCMTSDRLLYGG